MSKEKFESNGHKYTFKGRGERRVIIVQLLNYRQKSANHKSQRSYIDS